MSCNNDQYEKVCKDKFDEILTVLKDNTSMTHDLHKRMFVDNGRKSIQTRLNEYALWAGVMKWVSMITITSVLTGFIGVVFWIIRK